MDGVSYVVGNLGDPDDVQRAVRGAAAVIHAGATMSGDAAAFEAGTVVGTRNVVDACIEERVGQLVHISSMAVLDYGAADHGRPLDEWSALESRPHARGDYTPAKWLAEQAVRGAVVSPGRRAASNTCCTTSATPPASPSASPSTCAVGPAPFATAAPAWTKPSCAKSSASPKSNGAKSA